MNRRTLIGLTTEEHLEFISNVATRYGTETGCSPEESANLIFVAREAGEWELLELLAADIYGVGSHEHQQARRHCNKILKWTEELRRKSIKEKPAWFKAMSPKQVVKAYETAIENLPPREHQQGG